MKVIIAGSRDFNDYALLKQTVDFFQRQYGPITEIVCGMARGADLLGRRYGHEHNIPVREMPADWNRFGKSAGYKRNTQMAEYTGSQGALIAFHMHNSRGTQHMIDISRNKGMILYVTPC
jgi:hypothetical protein